MLIVEMRDQENLSMLASLSSAVERALGLAATGADRCGRHPVQTTDLLAVWLAETDGIAAGLLQRAGTDLTSLRLACRLEPPNRKNAAGLPLNDVLEFARTLAIASSDSGSVTTELLLVAICRHDHEIRHLLESHGLQLSLVEPLLPPADSSVPLEKCIDVNPPLDLGRVLDAELNRCREALRVIEDYCRFVLEDRFLSALVKEMRHQIRRLTEDIPGFANVVSRDTLRDSGTEHTHVLEAQRSSLRDVATASLKRLQESLRSLEEYGKLIASDFGAGFKRLRYRIYTLEKALAAIDRSRNRLDAVTLCAIVTDSLCTHGFERTLHSIIEGGAGMVQLREKHQSDRERLSEAKRIRQITREHEVVLIVNDRPDIAKLAAADGVHLGQDDLSVQDARRILGPDSLIGVSTHDLRQVRKAVLEGADYIGMGPTFLSSTKQFDQFTGLDFIREATREASLPAFAIGGIDLDNLEQVVAAGARRVAMCAVLCRAEEPSHVVRQVVERLRIDAAKQLADTQAVR